MKKSTMKKLMAKEIQKGFRKYAPIEDIERIDRQLVSLQWQIDVLYGAEPEYLRTPERHAWKTEMTERLKEVRKNHPDESVRRDYKEIFRRIYQRMSKEHGVDFKEKHKAYIEKHGLPDMAKNNVRTFNVVYDDPELRRMFEDEVVKFETWYNSYRPELDK